MTILLHFSDLHFPQSIDDLQNHINKTVDVLNAHTPFDKVIISISGDVALQGYKYEYKAADYFLRMLKKGISNSFSNIDNNISFLIVPGNHDINHDSACLSHIDLESIYSKQEYEIEMAKEIEKLGDFLTFSKKYDCFEDDSICCIKRLTINGKSVDACLINTAIFSLKSEEDKGLHYLPEQAIEKINSVNGDINVAIMHHFPSCYTDEIKKELINIFSEKYSILVVGHEHYESNENFGVLDNSVSVIRSASFFDKNWENSEFSVVKITDGFVVRDSYIWNSKTAQYENKNNTQSIKISNKNGTGLMKITEDFNKIVLRDERKSISDSVFDYFVFPRMEYFDYDNQKKSKEIKTENAFFQEFESSKLVYISGNHSLGKTTLLKYIFDKEKTIKFPLLLNADDFNNKNARRIIKNAFEFIYGTNPSDYQRFIQLPSSEKILLIDDVDRIKSDDFDSFMESVVDAYDYIVLTSTERIQFNWKEKLAQSYGYKEDFKHFKLTPLFKDKRYELVSALVPKLKTPSSDKAEVISGLCEALDSQKRFVFMTPDFIIQYVDYFCKNVGELSSRDTNVFSKVFEANLINSLTPHVNGKLNVDKMIALLSKIAFDSNKCKEYPITEKTIFNSIEIYNKDYNNDISAYTFIDICIKSKVLYRIDGGYKFTSKNYLAYFIAKEVIYQFNDTGNDQNICNIINYCCFGINADILLFIIYLSDKISILSMLIEMLHRLVDDWKEFDGNTNTIKFLNSPSEVKNEFIEKNTEEVLNEQVYQEKSNDDIRDIQTIEIYDYDESTVDEFINKVVKAMSLLNLISRAFPNFEHRIKADQKEEIVSLLYSVPNKIFYFWAKELESDAENFINYCLQKYDDYSNNLDKLVSQSVSEMKNMALSLLLDLYYAVVHEGCKTNTFDFFNNYDRSNSFTYQSEYLLMIELFKRKPDLLISLADKQIGNGDNISAELAKRILYHAINTMPNLNHSQKSKIADRIQLQTKDQKRIELKRQTGALNN